ncbi:hypothetical protein ACFQT0_13970 [Hymenobacter humi]|uniref:Uncharacterized protein n=1 Tax=Hymenobacter humi TaxID=1411620 RepID=A0ABW2U4L0_9BACT
MKPFTLYYTDFRADSAQAVLLPGARNLKSGWSPSGFGKVQFSDNGEKLFFGTAPDPIPQDTTLVEFEHAKLDIWNYKDDYLQPMQLKNLKKDLQRNYLAVIYPKQDNKFIQARRRIPARFVPGRKQERRVHTGRHGHRQARLAAMGGQHPQAGFSGFDAHRRADCHQLEGGQKPVSAFAARRLRRVVRRRGQELVCLFGGHPQNHEPDRESGRFLYRRGKRLARGPAAVRHCRLDEKRRGRAHL